MRICLNMRLAIPGKMEGIGWYSYEITRRLIDAHPEHSFLLIYDRSIPGFDFHDREHVTSHKLFPPARRPFLWKYWFNKSVTSFLKDQQCDLFVSFDGYLSLNSRIKQIAVIHDLNFEHYPEDMPKSYSKYFRENFPRFAQKATRIVTVSEFSKTDIVQQYKIEESKIDVVYNGVKSGFQVIGDEAKENVRKKYTDGQEFLIYVGSLHPRKNIRRLCLAFDAYKNKSKSDLKLVLVGSAMWDDEFLGEIRALDSSEDIIRPGSLPLSELQALCASAKGLCYVSYFEGFGVPILEGFASEVPVLTSNVSAMPEIAGEAALLVDPFSLDSISEGIEKITENEKLRSALIKKGTERIKAFDWDLNAERMWETIQKTLQL